MNQNVQFFSFFSFLFLGFSYSKYQQTNYLSGSLSSLSLFSKNDAVFGETDIYEAKNTPGKNSNGLSFLINDNIELLTLFGYFEYYLDGTSFKYSNFIDEIWKFSTETHQWTFQKGRKRIIDGYYFNEVVHNDEINVFHKDNQLYPRYALGGWKDQFNDSIIIFGGEIRVPIYNSTGNNIIGKNDYKSNDIWKYNYQKREWAVIKRFDNYKKQSNYVLSGEFHPNNRIGARSDMTLVEANNNQVFVFGGSGYDETSGEKSILGDSWCLDTISFQWKILGDDEIKKKLMIGALIDPEIIFLFGGKIYTTREVYSGGYYKYNTTSNTFNKSINGYVSNYQTFEREYDESPFTWPGPREGFKMWKINQNELIIIGGYGYGINIQKTGINDEWRFSTKLDSWKYSGQSRNKGESKNTIVPDSNKYAYSEYNTFGSIYNYFADYDEIRKTIYLCGGKQGTENSIWFSDLCWSIYYGNICFSKRDTDDSVCSSRGICVDHDTCSCFNEFYGENCELSKCGGILSNSSLVCNSKGLCVNGNCLCYNSAFYLDSNCAEIKELKFLNDYTVYFCLIVGGVLFLIVLIILIIFFCIFVVLKLRNKLKRYKGIDDIELLIQEAELEEKNVNPKIKLNKKKFEIDYSDIKLIKFLGEGGSQSSIYLADWKGTSCVYKGFKCANLFDTEGAFKEFENEVEVFSNFNHPYILQFFGASIVPPKVGILMQYCVNGDILTFLSSYYYKKKKKYSIDQKIRLLTEIASGMMYLHDNNVIHRDLKPENILIDENEHCKIMDFGLSKLIKNEEKTMTKRIGTSYYMSPDVLISGKYSNSCDVYSFAILIYVLITQNCFPYGSNIKERVLMNKIQKDPSFRPTIKKKDFEDCKFLIELMKRNWDFDTKNRNNFKEILDILKNNAKTTKKRKEFQAIAPSNEEISKLKKKIEEDQKLIKKLKQKINKLKNSSLSIRKKAPPIPKKKPKRVE